jgi:hypothetical protein
MIDGWSCLLWGIFLADGNYPPREVARKLRNAHVGIAAARLTQGLPASYDLAENAGRLCERRHHVLTPLLVQDNSEKGLVHMDFAVVLGED